MPNYFLCGQFHVKISVFSLVNTCTARSNIKESWFKSKRYVSVVLVWDCFGVEFCFMFSETAFVHPLHILVYVKKTMKSSCY